MELLDDMGLVRQGAVDTGSVNLGGTGPDGLPPASEFVYTNTFAKIGYEMQRVHRARPRPEHLDLRARLPAGRARVRATGRAARRARS